MTGLRIMCESSVLEETARLTEEQVIAFWEEYDISTRQQSAWEADTDLQQVSRAGVPGDLPEFKDSATPACDVVHAVTNT